MSGFYYLAGGYPVYGSQSSSVLDKAELAKIQAGFDLLPTPTGFPNALVKINSGATALDVSVATLTSAGAIAGLTGLTLASGTADLSAGTTKVKSAVNPTDAVNLTDANAILAGGATPGNIPITSLGKGTATALQLLRINAGATGVEGVSESAVAVTDLGVGTLTDGQFLKRSGTILVGAVVLAPWSIITADPGPTVAGSRYACNTTSAAFSVTLPAAPAANDRIVINDYAGTFATNALTISHNGKNIMGLAEDMTINTNNTSLTLDYIDATEGWRIV